MSLLNKLRAGHERQAAPGSPGRVGRGSPTTPAERPGPAFAPRGGRLSTALKDCLWQLDGIQHGSVLDLGPVWQTTVSFFIERNFKVYTEDLLLSWKKFLEQEERRLREAGRARQGVQDAEDFSPAALAERFLASNLLHPAESFDAMLLWDALDYLDGELVPRLAERLYALLALELWYRTFISGPVPDKRPEPLP